MNTVQRIFKNITVLFVARFTNYLLAFFYVIYTARYLGAEGYGILSFALAFTGIFVIFASIGLDSLTVREVARNKSLASKYLTNISFMKFFAVIITFGLIVLVINLLGYPKQIINVVYIIGLSIIFKAFTQIFNAIFRAFEQMEYQSLGEILNSALMLVGVIIAIKHGFNIIGFAFLYFISSIVILGYSFVICVRKFAPLKLEVDWNFWKESIKEAWPMALKVIFVVIYIKIDVVMLSIIKGNTAVGLYSAAYRLSEISTIVPAIFMTSIFPVMSSYYKTSINSFKKIYEKSIKYLFSIAIIMALIVTLLAKPIISIIYGNEFLGSITALQILIWAASLMYITMVLSTTFISANKQLLNMKLAAITVILNVVLNLIAIPKYSYIGASITTVITEAFGLFLGIFFLIKCGYKIKIADILLVPLFGFCIVVILIVFLTMLNVHISLILSLSVILYGAIIYILGISKDDKRLLKNILRRSK